VSETLVAVVQRRGRFWAAEPHFPSPRAGGDGRRTRGRRRIVLASNRVEAHGGETVDTGELVLLRLGGRGSGGKATVVRRIGRPEVARDAIEALLLDRGLAREFSPKVLEAADESRARGDGAAPQEVRQGRRRDLRDLATLTIDPASARDYDDAISAQLLDDREGVRVWVHIADVSAYVPAGSLVDREARRRGTSVYVPGAVEPMLPQALSNDACSLMPGADRATVTVELELRGAQVLRSAFYRSLIRSDARLDYERVDRVFQGRERAQEPWGAPLAAARAASAALAAERARAGGLVLGSEEPEVLFDGEGNVSEIRASVQTESHRLIEHLMIAANEAVARRLAESRTGCLYRVHERPEPARVARLIEQLASLGVPTPPAPEAMSPSQAAELMGELSQRVDRHVLSALGRAGRRPGQEGGPVGPWGGRVALTSLIMRSLQQACYSPRNIGHAGLHSTCYCHFTSPIRRYPDLVCHRALLSTLGAEQHALGAGELRELGDWTSECEREAMRIERDGDDIARCHALEQELYEGGWEQTFTGEVAGLISAGAFVVFGGAGASGAGASGRGTSGETVDGPQGPLYEGMLPVRRMRARDGRGEDAREWWELNEQETILRGERSGTTIRLGDAIEVLVTRVDTARGRVDLAPSL
jgi:ribonuclease R